MDTKGIGIVLFVFFLGGFAGLVGAGTVYEHNIAVQEYEPTSSVVDSVDVHVSVDSDGDEQYRPDITYQYSIDGETYQSDNVLPGQMTRSSSSQAWAEGIADQYAPGDEVEIHYNPNNPEHAYIHNDGWPVFWYAGFAGILVLMAAGVWLIRKGFRRRRERALVRDTPTERVESLSIGPSEVTGSAVCPEPIDAPFSDDECVLAQYEVLEYSDSSNNSGGSWQTMDEGVRYSEFYLDDGSGRVLVCPSEDTQYELTPGDWTTERVDSSDRGPPAVQEFVHSHDSLDFPRDRSGRENDRQYRQNLVLPDEEVYVFGTVQTRDRVESGASNAERLVIQKVEDDSYREPMYLISDDSASDLLSRRRFAAWRLPVGGLFLIMAFVYSIAMFSPLAGVELPVII